MEKIAVIYCRVSTEDQKDNGTSLESQERYCLDYAERQGWHVLRVVKEDASGRWLDRPVFASVREDIRLSKANVLLCYHADRMSRHQTHTLIFFDAVCEAGAELWFVRHGKIEDSPMGRAMLSLLATGAAMEHANIVERSLRGKRERALKGLLHRAGISMFGYNFEKKTDEQGNVVKTGKRIINPKEAAIVKQIFQWCADGVGCHAIATRLTVAGIPSPSSGKRKRKSDAPPKWEKTTIWRMLREEAYKGVSRRNYTCNCHARTLGSGATLS